MTWNQGLPFKIKEEVSRQNLIAARHMVAHPLPEPNGRSVMAVLSTLDKCLKIRDHLLYLNHQNDTNNISTLLNLTLNSQERLQLWTLVCFAFAGNKIKRIPQHEMI